MTAASGKAAASAQESPDGFGKQILDRKRDELCERAVAGAAEDPEARAGRILAVSPVEPRKDHHLLAGVPAHARAVGARHEWQRKRIDPGPDEEVPPVQPRRPQLDEDLAGPGLRIGDGFVSELVPLVDAYRLHQLSSPSVPGAQAGLESLLSGSVSIRSSPFATSSR